MADDTIIWLRAQQSSLDRMIADHLRRAIAGHPEWSDFELAQTLEDTWRLSQGKDCFYDRPSIGPTYASWYHARRVQDILTRMLPWLQETEIDEWSILDLGCGTGATLWSAALLAMAVYATTGRRLTIEYIGVDSSLFMLEEAERLWEETFVRAYPTVQNAVSARFGNATWPRVTAAPARRPRVVGGYLFDHSDERRLSEIAESLRVLIERHQAGRVLLLSSRGKAGLLKRVAQSFPARSWTAVWPSESPGTVWNGGLTEVHRARQELFADRMAVDRHLWNRSPQWSSAEGECCSVELVAKQGITWDLYAGRDTGAIVLDEEQEKASIPDDRPTIITGAAGSGKSLVLAERIARCLKSGTRRILVTAFNKAVIDQLARWTHRHLADHGWTLRKLSREGDVYAGHWEIVNPESGETVRLLNWDLAMTRIFGVRPFQVLIGQDLDEALTRTAKNVFARQSLSSEQIESISQPSFLIAERQRVMFGLSATATSVYLKVHRTGRIDRIGQRQRQAIADIFRQLGPCLMIDRRIEALDRVTDGRVRLEAYDLVVVDEVQDFTPADFKLLHALVEPSEHLLLGGDLTQAMQIGRSHRIPPLASNRRWKRHYLAGSYRIPLRICECLRPLAKHVADQHEAKLGEDAILPESRKAAVLGVRPILVYADTTEAMADQLRAIWKVYGRTRRDGNVQPLDRMTITERDDVLGSAIRRRSGYRLPVEVETMARIKGLERSFVVWSTRVPLERVDESEDEWIYTILSRAKHILVLVVGPETLPFAGELIRKRLLKTRIMPWTPEAKRYLDGV